MALTGHTSDEDAEKCRQAGMDTVMTKPLTLSALRTNLRELLQLAHS
jgi:CheY-like chemotaxis protein